MLCDILKGSLYEMNKDTSDVQNRNYAITSTGFEQENLRVLTLVIKTAYCFRVHTFSMNDAN